MTEALAAAPVSLNGQAPKSLAPAAARNLATTTKTVPQMQGISSRWLIRMLPWVQVSGGTYRVNRRLAYDADGGGHVSFFATQDGPAIVSTSLGEIPLLAGFADQAVLAALADGFARQEVATGETIVEQGRPADRFVVVVHGKVERIGPGRYGKRSLLATEAGGDYFGEEALGAPEGTWAYTATAATRCTLLSLPLERFRTLVDQSPALQAQLQHAREAATRPRNKKGEADITVTSGHDGEPVIPGTFADYDPHPREYPLSVAQTILRVHTRVADLFADPMDQIEQQLRLTIEALRERQEHEMVNHARFGLVPNVHRSQRFQTRSGPPTPDDLDELLCRRRSTRLFLAHPRAIAAFGRECNRRGIAPGTVEVEGEAVPAWRDVPLLPCDKIPISDGHTTTILAMRTGEDAQGVVGLRQEGIPHEYEPSLNVRFMDIDERAIIRYLVSVYYSVAVLVPDALGALENVEIS